VSAGAHFFNHCRRDDPTIAVLEAVGPNAAMATEAVCGWSWDARSTPLGTSPIFGSDDSAMVVQDNDLLLMLIPARARDHAISLANAKMRVDFERYQGIQMSFRDATSGITVLTIKGPEIHELLEPFHNKPRNPEFGPFGSLFKLNDEPLGYLLNISPDECAVVFHQGDLAKVEVALTHAGIEQWTLDDLQASGCALLSLITG
jgi:hypothetical protein